MIHQKVVMIYTGDDWAAPAPVTGSPLTTRAFEDWFERAIRHGFEMYRAEITWYDVAAGAFRKAWGYRNKRWQKIPNPIKPDYVLDKCAGKDSWPFFNLKTQIARKCKIVNDPNFRATVDGKAQQYLILGEFMPRSWLADSPAHLKKSLTSVSLEKIVAKALYGSGGKGIVIDTPQQVCRRAELLSYPILVQEFVTSTVGVPGFSTPPCLADLRVIFSDHRPVCALSRLAKAGSLFTNLHQGATATLVPLDKVPTSVQPMIKKITAKLAFFPEALYTLDFLFRDERTPVLIEMNTTPGADIIYNLGDEAVREKFFCACVVDHLGHDKSKPENV